MYRHMLNFKFLNTSNRVVLWLIVLIGCLSIITSCGPMYYNGVQKVNFCDLPNYEGKKVYIEASYIGVDEYWSLNSKDCPQKMQVELDDYRDGEEVPSKFRTLFDSVHHVYWKTYLKLTLVGTFESKDSRGYGHLGSNKARFIVSEYIDVELVTRDD